jgi:Na+-transporting NADH:ubiquinone oxidoreductase subunit NqrB
MTPPSTDITPAAPAGVTDRKPPAPPPAPKTGWSPDLLIRMAITAILVIGYYSLRGWLVPVLATELTRLTGWASSRSEILVSVWLVAVILFSLVWMWRKQLAKDKRWHAPLLVTAVLVLADAGFHILEGHHSQLLTTLTGGVITKFSPTFAAILTAALAEMFIGRFYYGKWPHLSSSFVSGISAGILVRSPYLWPFVLCALISITSKFVLRIGDRHLWNPTNFGMTVMLFLAPQSMSGLSVEAGNEIWAAVVIWILGGMILYNLGLLHLPVAFVATFIPLAIARSWWTEQPWQTELTPITSPMFQLFIFFMITDPKTTTKKKWSQILVAVLVGIAETVLRVCGDVHSLFHSLFIVGPIANLIEIGYHRYFPPPKKPEAAPAAKSPAVAMAKA